MYTQRFKFHIQMICWRPAKCMLYNSYSSVDKFHTCLSSKRCISHLMRTHTQKVNKYKCCKTSSSKWNFPTLSACHNLVPSGMMKYVNPYIPTQAFEEDKHGHLVLAAHCGLLPALVIHTQSAVVGEWLWQRTTMVVDHCSNFQTCWRLHVYISYKCKGLVVTPRCQFLMYRWGYFSL